MTQFESRKKVGQDRTRADVDAQIEAIEKEIRETPYHKGTEHHIGKLRARVARLKDRAFEQSSKKGGGGRRRLGHWPGGRASGSERGYAVKKQGDATIVLVGPPSVGKSTLLNKLTNAQSKVAPYAFTTVTVIPGMMVFKNAQIQILDVPGLIEGAEEGKGRGREVISVVRGADLLIIMTEVGKEDAIDRIKKALERNGIRLNTAPPDVQIDKKLSGGLIIHSNIKQDLDKVTIKEIASEFGVKNAEIYIKEKVTMDALVDSFSKNRVYVSVIQVINKADLKPPKPSDLSEEILFISAETGGGLPGLKDKIWEVLNFINVYLVNPGEEPNKDIPIIAKVGESLSDIALKIGSDFAEDKKEAKIWGPGAKFPGQEVSLTTKVQEGMQVRFV